MVPKGWSQTRLEHIAKIKSGSTPLRAKQDLYFSEDGTPWVKTLDLNNSEIIVTDERITELALKETSCSILPTNTVLVAMYGGFNQIGRTGLLTQPAAINQALSGLILDLKIAEPKYVLDYLNGNVGQWKKFAASSRKDPNITRQDVCSFEILLPPLPEQQKIAKILSTWDKAISTTERLIDNSNQQKKALMQQLLTGKKRLLDESGKRFEGEWEEVSIGSTSKCFSGGTPSRTKDEYYNGNIPWITSGKLNDRYVDSVNEYITELGLQNSSAKIVKNGSILVAMYGATAGKVALNTLDGATVNQAILALEPKEKSHNLFLFYLLEVEMLKALLLVQGGQPNLSATIIKAIKIKVPTYIEQQKIATVLTNADKEIELLKQQLADLQQEKKALMQVLLTGKVRVLV